MRTRALWMFIGAVSVIGAFVLVRMALRGAGLSWLDLSFASAAASAFGVGAMMMMHAPVKPWREPQIAAAVGLFVMTAGFTLQDPLYLSGTMSLIEKRWLLVLGATVVAAVAALGGALVVRRSTLREPSRVTLVALSTMLLYGLLIAGLLAVRVAGMDPKRDAMTLLLGAVAILGGSFVTQSLVSQRRVWTCSLGAAVVTIALVAHDGIKKDDILDLVAGIPMLVSIASIGARVCWRRLKANRFVGSAAPIPPVQVHQ